MNDSDDETAATPILFRLGYSHVLDLLTAAKYGSVGKLDVATHTQLQRQHGVFFDVTLDGTTITSDCIEANDQTGTVLVLKRNRDGAAYVASDGHGAAKETRQGIVRYVVRSPE